MRRLRRRRLSESGRPPKLIALASFCHSTRDARCEAAAFAETANLAPSEPFETGGHSQPRWSRIFPRRLGRTGGRFAAVRALASALWPAGDAAGVRRAVVPTLGSALCSSSRGPLMRAIACSARAYACKKRQSAILSHASFPDGQVAYS